MIAFVNASGQSSNVRFISVRLLFSISSSEGLKMQTSHIDPCGRLGRSSVVKRSPECLSAWPVLSILLALSQSTDFVKADGPYDSTYGGNYTIAYPTKEMTTGQADAVLSGLEGEGTLNEEQLRVLLPQLLMKQGVESGRIAEVGIGTGRYFYLCSQCEDFCSGRCVTSSNWGNMCLCWEPHTNGVQRSIIVLLLADPADETLALVAAVGSVPCGPPPTGMVAWYTGDDTAPSDLLGQHHGAFTGFPISSVDWVVGGGSLEFHFPDTYVKVPDHNDLDFGTVDFSIDMWIKTTAGVPPPTIQPILDKRTASPLLGYHMAIANGNLLFQLADVGFGARNYTSSLPIPNDGNWHFIAVTVDRVNQILTIYVDGNSQAFSTSQITGSLGNTADLLIGARQPSLGLLVFDGLMDEIEFFDRALTSSEVDAIRQPVTAGKCKCLPLKNGFGCRNVTCPEERERCIPKRTSYDPCEGEFTTLECACAQTNQCRLIQRPAIVGVPDGPPECVGHCPHLQFCTLYASDSDGDEILEYSCTCGPPTDAHSVGDVDRDGDVDLFDYSLLQNAYTGPK